MYLYTTDIVLGILELLRYVDCHCWKIINWHYRSDTILVSYTSTSMFITEMVSRKRFIPQTGWWLSASINTESISPGQESSGSVSKNILYIYVSLIMGSQDVGVMKGKYYALNFPLRDGISDDNYKSVFEPVGNSLIILTWALKKSCAGDPTSHGVVRSISNCPTMWYRFTLWRQTRLLEFVHARYAFEKYFCARKSIKNISRSCQLRQVRQIIQ